MTCENTASSDGTDSLQGSPGGRPFDTSATAWLVGQAVRYLNTSDKESELAYQRLVEVLRQPGQELLDTMVKLFRQTRAGDAPLRWNLLYLLSEAGGAEVADFLVSTALQTLPDANPEQCCEGTRDVELLVATMAIHALGGVAKRNPNSVEAVLKVVAARPARPLLIEAVKVGVELGLRDRIVALLPKEDLWIVDIRQAKQGEIFADPERQDGGERGFTPPKGGTLNTAPQMACCAHKGS